MVEFTIFVVDDELSITEGIKLALEGLYRIITFSEAESAIDTMKTEAPDIVLLDVGLPGMNGINAL
jgi:CheY-like chemotaxis protein